MGYYVTMSTFLCSMTSIGICILKLHKDIVQSPYVFIKNIFYVFCSRTRSAERSRLLVEVNECIPEPSSLVFSSYFGDDVDQSIFTLM